MKYTFIDIGSLFHFLLNSMCLVWHQTDKGIRILTINCPYGLIINCHSTQVYETRITILTDKRKDTQNICQLIHELT